MPLSKWSTTAPTLGTAAHIPVPPLHFDRGIVYTAAEWFPKESRTHASAGCPTSRGPTVVMESKHGQPRGRRILSTLQLSLTRRQQPQSDTGVSIPHAIMDWIGLTGVVTKGSSEVTP